MSYPGEGRGQEESGLVGDGQFVVSGGNAPPLFDLSEVVFHDVAALIRLSAQGGWSTTLGRIFGDVSTRFVMAQTSTVNPARRPRFCTGKRYLLQHGDAHQRDDLPCLGSVATTAHEWPIAHQKTHETAIHQSHRQFCLPWQNNWETCPSTTQAVTWSLMQ